LLRNPRLTVRLKLREYSSNCDVRIIGHSIRSFDYFSAVFNRWFLVSRMETYYDIACCLGLTCMQVKVLKL
jgi:hypothetical protein